jgi:hypothetical protein
MLQPHAIGMWPYDGRDDGTPLGAAAWVERYLLAESDFALQRLSGAIAAKRTDPTVILTVWAPYHEKLMQIIQCITRSRDDGVGVMGLLARKLSRRGDDEQPV